MLAAMPAWAFALMVVGGLVAVPVGRRACGGWASVPIALGAVGGRWPRRARPAGHRRRPHVAIVDGRDAATCCATAAAIISASLLAEASGFDGEPAALDDRAVRPLLPRCLRRRSLRKAGGDWRLLAIAIARFHRMANDLIAACAAADIVVADRRLPRGCTPRWLKLDRPTLGRQRGNGDHLARHDAAMVADGCRSGIGQASLATSTDRPRFSSGG